MESFIKEQKKWIIVANVIVLILACLWLYRDKDFEPFISAIGFLESLLLLIFIPTETETIIDNRLISDSIAKSIGLKFKNLSTHNIIKLDGSTSAKKNCQIEVISAFLTQISHTETLSGDAKYDDINMSVVTTSTKHKVYFEFLSKNKQFVYYNVKFSPALEKGEIIDYCVSFESKNTFLMTYEDVVRQIQNKNWSLKEPYEFSSIGVTYPTEKISFKITFPKRYPITGTEFWDITLNLSAGQSVIKDKLLKTNFVNFIKAFDEDGNEFMQIEDTNPMISSRYILKWIPPTLNEYNDILP
jgi:hypothetical protein